MTEPTSGGVPEPESRCPWCSTVVAAGTSTCPSCGAAIGASGDAADTAIPGVTSLDPITAARRPIQRPNRLVSWLAGDIEPLPEPSPVVPQQAGTPRAPLEPAGPASFAPPSAEVRLEMARLELEGIKAELEASGPEVPPPGAAADAISAPGATGNASPAPESATTPDPRSPGEGGAPA